MNERHRAALDMVYPIADSLQMNLMLNVKKDFGTGGDSLRIVGDQKINIPVSKDFDIAAECSVRASSVTPKESWVLAHVLGDLWVLVGFLRDDKELYFWLIDANRIEDGDRPRTGSMYQGKSISYLADKLAPGTLAVYRRKKEDYNWTKLSDALGISGPLSPGEAAETAEALVSSCLECLECKTPVSCNRLGCLAKKISEAAGGS